MMDLYIEPFGGVHDHGARRLGQSLTKFSVLIEGLAVPLQSKFLHFCYASFAGYFVWVRNSPKTLNHIISEKVRDIVFHNVSTKGFYFFCLSRFSDNQLVKWSSIVPCQVNIPILKMNFTIHSAQQRTRTSTLADWFLRPACLPFHQLGNAITTFLGGVVYENLPFNWKSKSSRSQPEQTP